MRWRMAETMCSAPLCRSERPRQYVLCVEFISGMRLFLAFLRRLGRVVRQERPSS